jgi:hypothetical protein
MVHYVDEVVGKRRLIVSIPTPSDKPLDKELGPHPSAPLTDDEIAEAMKMAGAAMGIDSLGADLSNIMTVSLLRPLVPHRFFLQLVHPVAAGVSDIFGENWASLPSYQPPEFARVYMGLKPIGNTVYLFDCHAHSASYPPNKTFMYHIGNFEGLNVMGEAEAVDDHILFAVKAPSTTLLRISIGNPSWWYFYNCRVIPQK